MEESTISEFIEHSSNQIAQLNDVINQFEHLNGQVEAVISMFELMHSEDDEENLLDVPSQMATRFESVANTLSMDIDNWIEMNIELRDNLQAMQTRVINISESAAQLHLSLDLTEAINNESLEIISTLNSKFSELQSAGDDVLKLTKAKSDLIRLVVAGFVEGENLDKFDDILGEIQDAQGERQ